jgi:hypothetical protein
MPVSIDPKDEKVWKYVVERKTPVTIKQAMKTLLSKVECDYIR